MAKKIYDGMARKFTRALKNKKDIVIDQEQK